MAAIIVCVQKVILHNKKRKILCKTTKEQKHEKMSNLMLTFLNLQGMKKSACKFRKPVLEYSSVERPKKFAGVAEWQTQ